MSARQPRPAPALARRLAEAEATIAALLAGQIDAVVDPTSKTPVLLAQAQEALRQERDRAQRYLNAPDVILLALDTESRIELANRYACSVLGWTADELIGLSWIEKCLPVRRRDIAGDNFRKVLAGDQSMIEAVVLTKSGDERLIQWSNALLRDEAGNVTGTFSSGTDVTERRRDEEALRQTTSDLIERTRTLEEQATLLSRAEERTSLALGAGRMGLWELDMVTGELTWSETMAQLFGLTAAEAPRTGDGFLALIHPGDRDMTAAAMAASATSTSEFLVEFRLAGLERMQWMEGRGRMLRLADGSHDRLIGVGTDITERKAQEARFRQAGRMEAIGQLASGVAHDLNNLLTVILGFTEVVIKDAALGSQHGRDLDEVVRAAERAAALTKQLLAFSRQQVLQAASLDVNGLITTATGMLRRLIGEHIEMTLALEPSLSFAFVDGGQLEQVVMNLVVNARDAMPDGGRVTIETSDVELGASSFRDEAVVPGHYVMLAVSDTGSGMADDVQRRLFEPFFTTKEPGRGTGLGLSTTYGIVKQSQGYIKVYSEPGVGTTFKVYLPRTTAVPAAARRPTAAPPPVSETVLLVEDEPGVRRLSRRILARAGYRVLEAPNGEEAEQIFADHADSIDLLVTDVVMPGCGGPELLRRLRVQTPGLKVLYMSGYTEQSAALKAGIDNGVPFVQKPFTAAEFAAQVRGALDR